MSWKDGVEDEYEDEDEDEEEQYEDSDSPDDSDLIDGEDSAENPCPYCGAMVSEMAERCPRCRSYLTQEDARARRPRLVLWGVGLLVGALILGLIFFIRN